MSKSMIEEIKPKSLTENVDLVELSARALVTALEEQGLQLPVKFLDDNEKVLIEVSNEYSSRNEGTTVKVMVRK